MDNYQTGTAANINVLLSTLDTWLVSTVGYTRNLTPTTVGSGSRAHYQITTTRGNTLYANFRSFRKETWNTIFTGAVNNYTGGNLIDGLAMNLSKAYTGTGVLFDIQGGHPKSGDSYHDGLAAVAAAYDNVPAYYFFHLSNPHLIIVLLEWQLGQSSFLIWGEPDSNGAGTFSPNNGYFFTGSSGKITPWNYGPTSSVFPDSNDFYQGLRLPFSYYQFFNAPQTTSHYEHNIYFQLDSSLHTGADGWLGPADDSATPNSRVTTYSGAGHDGYNMPGIVVGLKDWSSQNRRLPWLRPDWDGYSAGQRMVNQAAGVSVFFPIMLWWGKNNHDFAYLGSIPEVFFVSLQILTPGDTIVLGSDEYLVACAGKKPNPFDFTPQYDPNARADHNYGYGLVIKKN